MEFGRSKADDDNMKIKAFLLECIEEGETLDDDDLEHVVRLDFDYVRKQWQTLTQESQS